MVLLTETVLTKNSEILQLLQTIPQACGLWGLVGVIYFLHNESISEHKSNRHHTECKVFL